MEETETEQATTTETEAAETEPNGAGETDLEKWKGYAKTWEKRAKEHERELKKLKASQADPDAADTVKGELDALRGELEAMKAEKARTELVARVAAEKGVPASLLHGEDEDALKASADAIAAYVSQQVPGYPTDKGGAGKAKPMTREAIEKIANPSSASVHAPRTSTFTSKEGLKWPHPQTSSIRRR